MNAAHIHLVLNHLPVLGVVIAGALFGVALWYRNSQFQRVVLGLLVILALVAIPVYLSGRSAEEIVERLSGVSEQTIDRHEAAASIAFGAMEALGGFALLGMLLYRKAAAIPKVFCAGTLVLALGVSGLFGWAGYLGGQIRHIEIRADVSASSGGALSGMADRERRGSRRSERSTRPGDDD
jgi:hypothetical protein